MVAFFLTVFALFLPGLAHADSSQPAVVIVSVADVWSRPLAPGEKPSDALRETQVLYGEKVVIRKSSGPWVYMNALEQQEFTHHEQWEGYPGWVKATALRPTESTQFPTYPTVPILEFAKTLIGAPYLWGGLSKKGIDCSGLTYLSYRRHNIPIPRDAYEQWMKAKPIQRAELKPGDLIFSAKADNPKKITHVALYTGDGQIIEAPQNGMVVRKVSFEEKYGKKLGEVESGDPVGERYIYFGRYLN